MSGRKPFLLRMDPRVLQAVRHWADDDLRSLNGQIEFILRRALKDAGRSLPGDTADDSEPLDSDADKEN